MNDRLPRPSSAVLTPRRAHAAGSRLEPLPRQHDGMATTIYFWTYTCTHSGKRRRTRYRLTEDEAKARLIDPVRIEHGALTVEPVETTPAGVWRSGLVADDDDGGRTK